MALLQSTGISGSLYISSSGLTSGSVLLSVEGYNGNVFTIDDNLSGSLFSVNTISGIPVLEAFSDNKVNIGKYNAEAIRIPAGGTDVNLGSGSMFVTGSGRVGIGTLTPINKLDVIGNISASSITASNFVGTASWASNSLTASVVTGTITSASYALTASIVTGTVASSSYASTASVVTGNVTSASYALTSSFATTAASLVTTNNYTVNDLTASNTITASNLSASNVNGITFTFGNSGKISTSQFGQLTGTQVGVKDSWTLVSIDGTYPNGLGLNNTSTIWWANNNSVLNVSRDLFIGRDGITTLYIRNTGSFSSPQPANLRIYNYYTSSGADFERASNYWSASNYYIATEQSSSGLARNINFITSGSNRLFISASGQIGIGTILPVNRLDVAGNISASNITASLFFGTASLANNSLTASYVSASNIAGIIPSASYSLTSSYSLSSSFATTASFATNAGTASYITASNISGTVTSASYASTAELANSLNSANDYYVNTITTTSHVYVGDELNFTAPSGGYINNAYSINTEILSASNTITTNNLNALTSISGAAITGAFTGAFTGSLLGTSSWANNSLTAAFVTASNISGIVTSASYALTSSLSINSISSSYLSGSSATINNLTVTGILNATQISGSQVYVTSSTLTVTDNIITLNAASPYLRYAGLEMYDTGSGTLSNFLWDGQNNYFFLSSSAAGYSRKIITGPDNEGDLTTNYIPLITSSNGLINSVIYQTGSNIGIGTTSSQSPLHVMGSIRLGSTGDSSYGYFEPLTSGQLRYVQTTTEIFRLSTSSGGGLDLGPRNLRFGLNHAAFDVQIFRDDVGSLIQANGGTSSSLQPQSYALANYRSSSAEFERARHYWSESNYYIATEQSGSGLARNIIINTSGSNRIFVSSSGNIGIGTTSPLNKLDVVGNISSSNITASLFFGTASLATTSVTASYLIPANSYQVTNLTASNISSSGFITASSVFSTGSITTLNTLFAPTISSSLVTASIIASSQSLVFRNTTTPMVIPVSGAMVTFSHSLSQSAVLGAQIYGVTLAQTFNNTTASQTQTAFRVMPTFTGSFTGSNTSNIIADFGATSVGTQFSINDVTSGSIYMVNDVSGLPILEAQSDWTVNMYQYPNVVFKKSGSYLTLGTTAATSSVTLKSDLIIDESLGFTYRQSQVSGSTNGAVTSSIYNLLFTSTSSSVFLNAIVTGYDTGSRDTITGDIKATIRYRSGAASVVGFTQKFVNSDTGSVDFDILASSTSASLVVYGIAGRPYQWGATVTAQVI